MDGTVEVHVSIGDLQWHQLSGAGGPVYLPEEGYNTGIQKEIKDVKETPGSGKQEKTVPYRRKAVGTVFFAWRSYCFLRGGPGSHRRLRLQGS